jgi:hypothetical protein
MILKRSLLLLLAAVLFVPALAFQPATSAAAPAPASAPAGDPNLGETLIWTSMTVVANAYGTICYEKTFQTVVQVPGPRAQPGVFIHVCARPIDNKVLAGASWACRTVELYGFVLGAWSLLGDCDPVSFSAANQPYRLINADWLYHHPSSGLVFDVDLVNLKVDVWGNAAGLWEWDIHENLIIYG